VRILIAESLERKSKPSEMGLGSRAYVLWINTPMVDMAFGVDDESLAQRIWEVAQKVSESELKNIDSQNDESPSHSDSDIGDFISLNEESDDNCGFSVKSSMDIVESKRYAKNLKKMAENVLEFYAGDIHPEEIKVKDIKDWSKETRTPCDPRQVHDMVNFIVGRIPGRSSSLISYSELEKFAGSLDEFENLKVEYQTKKVGGEDKISSVRTSRSLTSEEIAKISSDISVKKVAEKDDFCYYVLEKRRQIRKEKVGFNLKNRLVKPSENTLPVGKTHVSIGDKILIDDMGAPKSYTIKDEDYEGVTLTDGIKNHFLSWEDLKNNRISKRVK
jgi:hypothetical protein